MESAKPAFRLLSLPWACGSPMGTKAHCEGSLIPNGLPRDFRRSVARDGPQRCDHSPHSIDISRMSVIRELKNPIITKIWVP